MATMTPPATIKPSSWKARSSRSSTTTGSATNFPFETLCDFRTLGIAGPPHQGYGCPGKSTTLMGFVVMELARIDASVSTFSATKRPTSARRSPVSALSRDSSVLKEHSP
ncbi:MAG: Acyl-CoA dehydrogenase [Ramlibacter sp.]|nr:Acyl-CoA dehydrogenase [Ramlibacter sp.]